LDNADISASVDLLATLFLPADAVEEFVEEVVVVVFLLSACVVVCVVFVGEGLLIHFLTFPPDL